MNTVPFSYVVLRYSHDPAAGESLNVGVVLFCPTRNYIGLRFEHRYERLSSAFSNFRGDHYRHTLQRFEKVVRAESSLQNASQISLLRREETTLHAFVSGAWPESDLSFRFSSVRSGITENPSQELELIFDRFVTSQCHKEKYERRDDNDVWTVYRRSLLGAAVRVEPTTIRTPEFDYHFERAFKNGRWHILEAVSLDYAKADQLRERATSVLGLGSALARNSDIAKVYLLLGRPKDSGQASAYARAKTLMDRIPLEHELVEEESADQFAHRVAKIANTH
jgi:hypothetical protein